MKKILILVLIFMMVVGILLAEEVNIERLKTFPERYEDKKITLKLWISGEIEKFEYEDGYYFIGVYDNKQNPFYTFLLLDNISFVTPINIAEAILDFYESNYASAERTILIGANLVGALTSYSTKYKSYWIFVVIKIELRNRDGSIFKVLE